jgi:hypothetical protein
MEDPARRWLASLTAAQADAALQPFARRTDWHYVPRTRPGLRLGDMDEGQRAAAWALVETALGAAGLAKAHGVVALETVLGELEGRTGYRDPGNYALALFGAPRTDAPWAWRIEGHHLALTVTLVPGEPPALTPAFFGANPAVVPHDHARAGDELLATERALGFALVESLEGAPFARAMLAAEAPRDILTGPGAERRLAQPEGVPFAELADGQRALGWRLVQAFLRHLRDDWRRAEEAKIREAGLDRLHFAWAGCVRLGAPHYFRLHGPRTVIEYDNVQNGANHVHTVWHDPTDVFGEDRLARHHRVDHGSDGGGG